MTHDTYRGTRLPSDLDAAFVAACRSAGELPSDVMRGLIERWTLSVHEARDDERPLQPGAVETPTDDQEARPDDQEARPERARA